MLRLNWTAAAVVVACAAGQATAVIIYDVPAGITAQPTDNAIWNSSVSWQVGGGTAIAPHYFLTAQHLGGAVGQTASLTTVVSGAKTTSQFTVAQIQDFGTDLRLIRVNETFSTYVALYSGAAGSEAGQSVSMIGLGPHIQGTPVTSVGGTVQNGWLWGGGEGVKSFGQNTVNDVPTIAVPGGNLPTLHFTFDPIAGQNEGIYGVGDSGGGAFITVSGTPTLAGVSYGISQYYTAGNDASAINAAIYNGTGLFQKTDAGPFVAVTAPQDGFASEIAPYASQINAALGVPEPASVAMFGVAGIGLLMRRRRSLAKK